MSYWPNSTYPTLPPPYPVQDSTSYQLQYPYLDSYSQATRKPHPPNLGPYPPKDAYPPLAQPHNRPPLHPRDPPLVQYSYPSNPATIQQAPPTYPGYEHNQRDARPEQRDPWLGPRQEFDYCIADQECYQRDPRGATQDNHHSYHDPPQRPNSDQPWVDDRYGPRERPSAYDPPSRLGLQEHWVNGEGISREVIKNNINAFLGLEAYVRPEVYKVRPLALERFSNDPHIIDRYPGSPRL